MKKEIDTTVATNKKAYHDYFIEETFEAGIELVGSEVKSIRNGQVNLKDSYVMAKNGELKLINCHISPYEKGSYFNLEPKRDRKLLMHKKEILKLKLKTEQKGYTLIATRMYFKGSLLKVEVALCKGKELFDKRRDLKEKQVNRDVERQLANLR